MSAPQDNQPTPIQRQQVIDELRTVFDPELPVNIYDLGLIYDVSLTEDGVVKVDMTLTTPACPVAGILPMQVEAKIKAIPGVRDAAVTLVWDPPWSPQRMSEAARLQLNMDLDADKPSPSQHRKHIGIRLPRK